MEKILKNILSALAISTTLLVIIIIMYGIVVFCNNYISQEIYGFFLSSFIILFIASLTAVLLTNDK